MRTLLGPEGPLAEVYAPPPGPWLRVNFVQTVDGAATGADGRSGSINNAADKQVFDLLRRQADAVVVGAGTARAEGYRAIGHPLVVVSRRCDVPERLVGDPQVLVVTCAAAEGLAEARERHGADLVLPLGEHDVDLARMCSALAERGWDQLLCEGGPHLFGDLLAAGLVDELCCTTVPRLVAGEQPRIVAAPPVDVPLRLHTLVEDEGTLMARWLVERRD
jgi:riboflavin biosynthesis pyrimidine reductase